MKVLHNKQTAGFTLIELMVVVMIIIILAAISIPATLDFMRNRNLRNAGSAIQACCLRARSRAIAQREKQYLIFFVDSSNYAHGLGGTIPTTGNPNSICICDSNESDPGSSPGPIDGNYIVQLPELTSIDTPAVNFYLTFHVDGTVEFSNITDKQVDPEDASTGTPADIRITQPENQPGNGLWCYLDIVANTGRVRFATRDQ